jgi:nucleotide-binding universal stress UspA family protein
MVAFRTEREPVMSTDRDRRSVVVGVDGSPESLHAVRWAAVEAARRRLPLRLVTAFDTVDDRINGLPGVGSRYQEILMDDARAHLEAARVAAGAIEPDLVVDPHLVLGFPTDTLVTESRQAHLVVVGDRGIGRIAAMVGGSVAVGLVTHARCPVVVVREAPRAGATAAPVVLGVDGSKTGDAAIGFAFEAASIRRAPLVAVHTWGAPPADTRTAVFWDVLAADAREQLAGCLAGWGEKYPDVHVDQVVSHSRPAGELLAWSERAQLLVVGSRGHGEFTGTFLGSVGNVLIHRASCPVAVVRAVPASA